MVWDAFPLEKEVEAVAAIAVAAGHLILKIRESGFECQTKGDNTLVTPGL